MKVTLALGILLLVVATGIHAQALGPWVLYDNFNAPLIDPNKWFGAESGPLGSSKAGWGAESLRFVQGGRLRIAYRSFGNITSDANETASLLNLNFVNPTSVTAVKATLLTRLYALTGCPSNVTTTTRTRVRLLGTFFNAGTPIPGDSTNNVYAQIRVIRRVDFTDPIDVFRVQGYVFRCNDSTCDTTTDLPIVTLGNLTVGTAGTVAVQWDRGNRQFLFSFDATQAVVPYPWPDATAPSNPIKRLEVANGVPNCTSSPRPMAFLESSFDDVYVNR